MEVVKLFALVASCTLITLSLQGCSVDSVKQQIATHSGNAYNAAVSGACQLLVNSHLDELLQSADQTLEEKCKADNVLDDSKCVGWAVFASMSIEEQEKEKWSADCVTKVGDAVAAAGNNLGALQQFLGEWWGANGAAVKAEVTNLAQSAGSATAGAATQSLDAAIAWVCSKKVEGAIDKIVLDSNQALAAQCQNVPTIAQACQTSGDTALTSLDSTEVAKYNAECVGKTNSALSTVGDKWGTLRTKVLEYVNSAEAQSAFASIRAKAQSIVSQATTTGGVTAQRLYAVALAVTQSQNLGLGVVASGLLAITAVGALVMRLRRTRTPELTEETTELCKDNEIE
jgi:hypothetical protein